MQLSSERHIRKSNRVTMPRQAIGQLSYRMKCYSVENEKLFGDIIVTQQTLGRLYIAENWQVPSVYINKGLNLAQQILETPDFMALNRLSSSKRKRRSKISGTMSTLGTRPDIFTVNYNGQIDNHNHCKGPVKKQRSYPLPVVRESTEEVVVSSLVDQLLLDIYGYPRGDRVRSESDSTVSPFRPRLRHHYLQRARLELKSEEELAVVLETLRTHINHAGGLLIRQLRRRDYLSTKRDRQYDVITAHLQAYSNKRSEDTRMRFSLTPQPGESGFTQWLDAMKMVARLSGGIPQEFRKRLWLTLAERHLEQRGVDWKQAEKLCFNEWTNPDDEELGIQIVKDLHRTGCSLFCGAAGRDNQAVLRRVLLGFARWNKSVGYCQGLNVLAALILQVTDRAEASAVKVMIYLIEGVLPEGYFADNLRGLSVDMAVFRDLLRMRLPKLSKHLEALQCDIKDKATGSSYEPPLTNVFTMQWFLTLFCHCLPQDAVLRVWDLIFLEGDEVLLRTALAIWEGISDRIMTVTSADEFYSIMGVLTREMLEFTDTNHLIKTIVSMGPLHGITDLREKHRYNITPWARRLSDDEDTDTEEEERLAVAAAAMFDVPHRFKKAASGTLQTLNSAADRDRLALDINTLKQQYAKLRERQRQTHIILSGKEKNKKPARQTMLPSSTSQAMNHLLVGKSALVSSKTRQLGPPPGSIPPKTRVTSLHSPRSQIRREKQGVTLHWKDTKKLKETKNEPAITDDGESESLQSLEDMPVSLKSSRRGSADSDSDSTSTELCDEPDHLSDSEEPTSTSDYYVMATDDEKSPRLSSSPVSGSTPIRSSRDSTKNLSPNSKNGSDNLDIEETSSSIAKITDQIRRLSAGDDSHSVIVRSMLDMDRDDSNVMHDDELEVQLNKKNRHERNDEDTSKSLDSYDFLSGDSIKFSGEKLDSNVSVDKGYSSTKEEILSSIGNEDTNLTSKTATLDEIKKVDDTSEVSECALRRKDNIELMYSPRSFDISQNIEVEFPSKVPISARSNTIDTSTIYSSTPESEPTKINNTESLYYPGSYVIGHLPISPITVDQKLIKLADSKVWTNPIATSNEEMKVLSPEAKIQIFDVKVSTLSLDYHSSGLNIYHDKKSPKTPESAKSFSSGETMGPDSKVSSMATTPHTPMRSDSCKFGTDKSGRSSISSDSKTLTLVSMDSDAGHTRSKVESRSEITRPSFEQSTPSTPISTDSLKNKSDVSPSKLIVSSSSDSYNSPGKVKYSERSFSSGLQSPISANSIKYVASYRGQEDLSESPKDAGSATSPFYPILIPNEKSPSPNRVMSKPKNGTENHEVSSEKSSSSKESTKSAVYLFEDSPTLSKGTDAKLIKNTDDYDSGRSFEAELAATLSSKRLKNEKDAIHVNSTNEKGLVHGQVGDKKALDEDIQERLLETDTVSPLPRGRYEVHSMLLNVSNISDKNDENYSTKTRESKLFERSCSSLDKRVREMKLSTSSEDFLATKKRSSDILADLRHLEANSSAATSTADICMAKKTGYDWEDLKNLEARRQDTFSDSASEFSKYRLDIPSISVSSDGRKGYVVEPKIQIDENSDSILKNYTQKKGEPDYDRESKLGVWTKVKPRRIGENGRRSSSDRALKIIQENSAILHKILTCQAKKCLPDLEEISKEITISPINEEISKIFSPILEKMGLNEHEINEELARINFKDFDQMTTTSGSEFDAKINDELCKLSLIDDNEEVSYLDVDDMIAGDYLDTREALIDKQINEELSKLLANYEQASPISQGLRDKGSSSQNPSEIEGLDLSSISTNVFSYKSSNDSIETKSDLSSIQDSVIQSEKFSQYTEGVQNYGVSSTKYELQNLSPRSDIDIYRELEKLDKISSACVFPLPSRVTQKLISPNAYTTESPSFTEVPPPSSIEYSTMAEKPFEPSPMKSPHTTYKPYDFPISRISPLKTSNNPFTARPYETSLEAGTFEFNDRNVTNSSRSYDLEPKRQILSKETLEFRVRYDDENLPIQQICEDDFSLEPYQTDLPPDLDRGASYYAEESPITLKRLTMDSERALTSTSVISPLEYSYDKPDLYTAKYSSVSPDNYVYSKSVAATDYERKTYQLSGVESEVGSYMPLCRRESHSLSPNYQFSGHDFVSSISTYVSKLSPSLEAAGPVEPLSHPEFAEKLGVLKYTEVPARDSIAYRKASMTLGPLDASSRVPGARFSDTPSPKTQFSPFPVRNTTRRPKELGLKLGLYSPSSPGSGQSKRS